MNKFLFPLNMISPIGILWLALMPLASATSYQVKEITRDEIGDTVFTINGGNQNLNNNGQVIGTSKKYSKDKVYNFGDRAFLWDNGAMKYLGSLGTDVSKFAYSFPQNIADSGNVVGRSSLYIDGITYGNRAYLWKNGKLTNLTAKYENFMISDALATNAGGWILGYGTYYEQGIDRGVRLFLWKTGKIQSLSPIIGPYGRGIGLNINNQVAGDHINIDDQGNIQSYRAFIWSDSALTDLPPICIVMPDYSYGNGAFAINDRNTVLGTSDFCDPDGNMLSMHAVLWTDGKPQDIGALGVDPSGYSDSYPVAFNNNNQVTGVSSIFDGDGNWLGQHGFYWESGSIHDMGSFGIDEFGYSFSTPYAINAKGQVVGFSTYSEDGVAKGNRAFLYEDGNLFDLNALLPSGSGLVLENALAINDKGQIVAFGKSTIGADSYQVYVLLTPVS